MVLKRSRHNLGHAGATLIDQRCYFKLIMLSGFIRPELHALIFCPAICINDQTFVNKYIANLDSLIQQPRRGCCANAESTPLIPKSSPTSLIALRRSESVSLWKFKILRYTYPGIYDLFFHGMHMDNIPGYCKILKFL